MTPGPETLIEFQEMFPNEDGCWAHLRAVRWPDGFQCPACRPPEAPETLCPGFLVGNSDVSAPRN